MIDRLLAPDGLLVATLVPVAVCVVAAIALSMLLRVVGRRLLEDGAQADALARTALVGVTAVGVLLGLGRLVDREATDAGLRAALAGIVTALPGLTIMFILLIAALLVAAVLRAAVTRAVATIRPSVARVAGAVTYWTVVILVALIAAEQAGIDVSILRQLLLLVATGLVAAIALALGLGMRGVLSSVIAGRHVDSLVEVGSPVAIGEVSGHVERVGAVSVRIRTDDGRAVEVPHAAFLEGPATLG